ncbi:unnamed protein product [Pneumocystis jirovecii]|uniref:Maintenance of telomere capping protein 1 n=2 Tax=Pneumocystis jirovecii TaxID=42068 RepID=L0PDF5_PNEJI|nr:uncharacterized protein T551_02301 [Pneumocystis jirovecii RU7]KTW29027.1 hypothetical protein T551_02301 [Pneumocystis jirovecii RU7]CCJ28116.1 unnamed protein product [Pneumocystis jirovecii]CCJ30134.1 unnamed protein product [Pneumocystis jirovecii]
MSDKKEDFMSLFDSIDKIDSKNPPQDFPIENIQDEKAVFEFLDDIVKKKPLEEQENKLSDKKNVKENVEENILHEKSPKTSLVDKTLGKKIEKTWFEGILDNTSFFFKQAEEKVKQFQHLEGKKIEEKVRNIVDTDTLGKFGNQFRSNAIPTLSSTFNYMLNVVAPPISLHEILEIEIYHNLVFFPKLDQMVYSIFDEIISHIENEDVVIQKGKKNILRTEPMKEFRIFEEYEAAIDSAKEHIIPFLGLEKKRTESSNSLTIYTSIYISIQAYSFNLKDMSSNNKEKNKNEKMFSFVIYLNDPYNELELNTQSQALPIEWLYQLNNINMNPKLSVTNLNLITEQIEKTLQLSIGVIAQLYIEKRDNKSNST